MTYYRCKIDNDTDKSDFETNYKESAKEMTDTDRVNIYNDNIVEISYADFKAKVSDWSAVYYESANIVVDERPFYRKPNMYFAGYYLYLSVS